jgi:hypothetical protein
VGRYNPSNLHITDDGNVQLIYRHNKPIVTRDLVDVVGAFKTREEAVEFAIEQMSNKKDNTPDHYDYV